MSEATHTVLQTTLEAAVQTVKEMAEFVDGAKEPVVVFFAFDAGVPEDDRKIMINGNMGPEVALSVAVMNMRHIARAVEESQHVTKN